VEAQFSGLPCVFSGEITRELRISDKAWYLSIERSPEQWAEFILRLKKRYRFCESDDGISDRREADPECRKMDISYTKDILQNYYLEKWSML